MQIIQNPNDFSPFKFQVIIKNGNETKIIEMLKVSDLKKSDKIISKKESRFKSVGVFYTVERKVKKYKKQNFRHLWQAEKFVKNNA